MENSGSTKQSRLLGRLLGRLRGEHRYSTLDKNVSFSSTGHSNTESIGCGSVYEDEEEAPQSGVSNAQMDNAQFAANIDMRYSGQYLTPEQLPEFCNQLNHLVEVIRNIQSYGQVAGEYPREMERQLEREASEVAALASEARNAHDTVARVQLQRRALNVQRSQLTAHLAKLRESEVRELETSVRISDRKLFKNWETVKNSTDPAEFESLLEDVRTKQTALESLVRLIEGRLAQLSRATPTPYPLPPPINDDTLVALNSRRRYENRRSSKRKRSAQESSSFPTEPTQHEPKQVTLYITGGSTVAETTSRRATSVQPSLELPRGSLRDIMFFTAN